MINKIRNNVNLTGPIVYVNQAASPGGDGTSWSTAFTDLQDGIESASINAQIWIAQGTYLPTSTSGDTTSTFKISKNNLGLYGGFKGTETNLNQRDISQYETILSGKIDGNTNSEHVVTITSYNSIIDGITISDGDGTGSDDGASKCNNCFGAGILFKNPLTTGETGPNINITSKLKTNNNNNNNDIFNTYVQVAEDVKYYLNLTSVTIKNNIALQGAGLFAFCDSIVTITDSVFSDNTAEQSTYHVSGGGAIYSSVSSELSITNTQFTYVFCG